MSDQAIDVKTGGSTTHTVVMIIGGVLLLAGIGFVLYIIFNNPVTKTLAGLFNDFTTFAKGVESAFEDCFTNAGNWNANCLWMYLGALVMLVPYAISKLGAQTTAGSSEVVKRAAFETGKSNDQLADDVKSYMEENEAKMREEFESKGITGADQDYAVESAAAKMLEQQAIEEKVKAGGDREAVEKNMAEGLNITRSEATGKYKLSEEDAAKADEAADDYVEDHPPPIE